MEGLFLAEDWCIELDVEILVFIQFNVFYVSLILVILFLANFKCFLPFFCFCYLFIFVLLTHVWKKAFVHSFIIKKKEVWLYITVQCTFRKQSTVHLCWRVYCTTYENQFGDDFSSFFSPAIFFKDKLQTDGHDAKDQYESYSHNTHTLMSVMKICNF